MTNVPKKVQVDYSLNQRLLPVILRERIRRFGMSLGVAWFFATGAILLFFWFNQDAVWLFNASPAALTLWLGIAASIATLAGIVLATFTQESPQQVARRIEAGFPELDSILLTAIEQQPNANQQLSFLQQDVIRNSIYHSYRRRWSQVVPGWQLAMAIGLALTGMISLSFSGLWIVRAHLQPKRSLRLSSTPTVQTGQADYEVIVEPGDVEIERGRSLLILARFPIDVPPAAELVWTSDDSTAHTQTLTKSLDDPVFASRISEVKKPLTYRIHFGERSSPEYHVSVFDFPALLRSDAGLTFPEYTRLPPQTLPDVRRLSAVVGTQLQMTFHTNKELESAQLVADDSANDSLTLARSASDPRVWTASWIIQKSQKFELLLQDSAGRVNLVRPRLSITAIENQPPKLSLEEPSPDIQVSALEEVNLLVAASDDFGLERVGLSLSVGGVSRLETTLAEALPGKQRNQIQYLLDLEQLSAEPDQLLSYYFWADDYGADGTIRRTASDMFFIEVRPFEEVYRQAQGGMAADSDSAPEGGQGNANSDRAQALAELQMEIINATWRVIRREANAEPSGEFATDVNLLLESQQSAFDQVDEFAQQLEDPQSAALADQLRVEMLEALDALRDATQANSPSPLDSALKSEQSAYQILLRMRAREFQVQQANRSSSTRQAGNQDRQQRQMQQLNLQPQSDRYQQERLAQDQQAAEEQRENRQVLSRLRELARRQNDLNKRIKESQSALQEAESDAEREEIAQQLKRLQDEQQQILRDTDELQERMQQPANQPRMADSVQQLADARQNVQQTNEALQQGEISRAAAEGTRAERQLSELREEFQRQTSGQFDERMRQMRNQARDLEQQQQQLAESMAAGDDRQSTHSLSSSNNSSAFLDALEAGKRMTDELRENIKQTIEEAESFEPVLADRLYDTYRQTEQTRPDQALDSARQSMQQGWVDDARLQQQRAVEGISQLRVGIDHAAEGVLGDEVEALRQAQETLEQLSQQLEQEMRRSGSPADSPLETDPLVARDNSNPTIQPPLDNLPSTGEPRNANDALPSGQPSDSSQSQPSSQAASADPSSPGGGNRGQPSQNPEPNRNARRLAGDANPDPQSNRRTTRLGNLGDPNELRSWAPLTGEDFTDWSDRLRDVEEMLANPNLRAQAARIRDQAKAIRRDLQRHSQEPNWDLVEMQVAEPLSELADRVAREIMRRDDRSARIPLDQEPVPVKYQRAVEKYYQELGVGK